MAGNREIRKRYAKKAMDEIFTIETELLQLQNRIEKTDLKTVKSLNYDRLKALRRSFGTINREIKMANHILLNIDVKVIHGYYLNAETEAGGQVHIPLSTVRWENKDYNPNED